MAKSNEKKVVQTDRDELAQSIADALNKFNKDGEKIAFFLDGADGAPTEFTEFVSTGATMLDIAVSNRPHGGIAVGRITEITGLEGSGKSLVCAHLMANTQKMGGVAVLIDTETAVNREFYQAIGLDLKKLVWIEAPTVEDVFDRMVHLIEHIRKLPSNKDKIVTIVVDSVAAASTRKEMEADFSKDGYATDKAIIISKALRKITGMIAKEKIALVFTNQLRQKMNAQPFADQWTTSGGKAIAFHASTRIRLSQIKKLDNKKKEDEKLIIGVKVEANVVKNRLGPPHRKAEFEIYFDRGIDDYNSWLDALVRGGMIKQSGAWYTYVDDTTGEEIKFQSKDFGKFLEEDKERKERLYNQMCDALIMKYQEEVDPVAAEILEEFDND
jgi:recombination protein RecA